MSLTKRQISQLQKIIETAQAILSEVEEAKTEGRKSTAREAAPASSGEREPRTRRSGKELAAFRKMLKAERKKGVPVSEIAQKHNVSKAYVYQL